MRRGKPVQISEFEQRSGYGDQGRYAAVLMLGLSGRASASSARCAG
jgi:hypothetical protein